MAHLPTNYSSLADQQRRNHQASSHHSCHDTEIHNENEPYFGDTPGPKRRGRLRLHCLNVNNLPLYRGEPKDKSLFNSIRKYSSDILLLQEIGVNWSRTAQRDQWSQRLLADFDPSQTKTKYSHNVHDMSCVRRQWGGTGIATFGKLAHYTMGAGSDKAKLGRWTWARYRGKGGVVLRVVSVYNPCSNKTGELSVYAQHKQYFQTINRDIDPREAFIQDLDSELTEWLAAGDQIIIGGDLNNSVLSTSVQNFFRKHHMHNLIFARHDPSHAPATYRRSTADKVIDGLWATPNIHAERCGYMEAGEFPGDHSALWVDITYTHALGHDPPLPQTMAARRLKLQDPTCVKRYTSRCEQYVDEKRLCSRQFQLEREVTAGIPLTPDQILRANNIDRDRTHAMLKADKKCRKMYMGAVEFSNAVDLPVKQIEFWDLAIKRRKGLKISQRLYDRHKRKALIKDPTRNMTLDQLFQAQRQARAVYNIAKTKDHDSRLAFLDHLPPKARDRLLRTEAQRRLARASKRVTGKLGSKSVTKVEHNGQEYTTQKQIEDILLPINRAKMHACETTPFLQEPLLSEFGYGLSNEDNMDRVLHGIRSVQLLYVNFSV